MRRGLLIVCVSALGLAACAEVPAEAVPTADLPRDDRRETARMAWPDLSAVALSVVAPDAVDVLHENGVMRLRLSGPGLLMETGERIASREIDAPRDLDATNGQDLYVADGSRVLRFSAEGRLVQTLSIPSALAPLATATPTASPGDAVAVAAGVEGTVYVAEATRSAVQVWREGGLADVWDGLGRPVSLATRGRTLYVGEGDVVRVLDTAGQPIRTLRHEVLSRVTSVSLTPDHVVVLGLAEIVLFPVRPSDSASPRVIPITGGATLLDAAVLGGRLVVLTADAVHVLGRVD